MTDSKWTVTMQYNLTNLQGEVKGLTNTMESIKEYLNTFFNRLLNNSMSEHSPLLSLERNFRYEYTVLQHTANRYIAEVDSLLTLLPTERRKRGLLDSGGHALRFLFGTLDQSDLESLNHKINYLYDTTENIIHSNQEQLTLMKKMETQITSHAQVINQLVTGLKTYHERMHKSVTLIVSRQNALKNSLDNLYSYLKINAALNDAKTAIYDARDSIESLHRSIENLAAGKLSSELISPPALTQLLQEITAVLEPSVELCVPATVENAHDHYQLIKAKAYSNKNQLIILLTIPLKANQDTVYKAYRVTTYPVYVPELHRWAGWKINNEVTFLIARDQHTYTVYDNYKFQQECYHGKVTICPVGNALYSTSLNPNCITELYLSDQQKHCERKLWSNITSPVLTKINEGWLYSTSKEHVLSVHCPAGHTTQTKPLKISGVGRLNINHRCEVVGTTFILPARHDGSSSKEGELPSLVLPAFEAVLAPAELQGFTNDLNTTLKTLEEMNELHVSEIDLGEAIKTLELKQLRGAQYNQNVKYIASGTVTFSLIITFVVLFACRKRIATWRRRQIQARRDRDTAALAQLAVHMSSSLVQLNSRNDHSGPARSGPA